MKGPALEYELMKLTKEARSAHEKNREHIPAPNGPFDPNVLTNNRRGLIVGGRMRKR